MKTTTNSMIYRLKEISESLPKPGSSKRKGVRLRQEVIDEVLGFYDQGLPQADIVKILGIAPSTFLRWSKKPRSNADQNFRKLTVSSNGNAMSKITEAPNREARIVLGSGCTMYVDIEALDTGLLNRLRGL